ncbi:MAG: response regulator [Rubrivivax sp.]
MKRILIIEDQSDIRQLLQLVFDDQTHYLLAEAGTATEGLQAAIDFDPDLVLLDIMMPGPMDGLEACRLLKTDPTYGRPHVVILSAMGRQDDFDRGTSAGADAYLSKPFSPSVVQSTVELLLGD